MPNLLKDFLFSTLPSLPPPLHHHSSSLLRLLDSLHPFLSHPYLHSNPFFHALHHHLLIALPQTPPNLLQELHILRSLLLFTNKIRTALLRLARENGVESFGKGKENFVPPFPADERHFMQLFNGCKSLSRKAYMSCIDSLSDVVPITSIFSGLFTKYATIAENDPGQNDVDVNACVEALIVAESNLQALQSSVSAANAKLLEASKDLKAILLSSHSRPNFISSALLRETLHSCFYGNLRAAEDRKDYHFDDGHESSWISDRTVAQMNNKTVLENAEQLIEKLQEQRGPMAIWISGESGIGKSSLVSCIASNGKISRRFPGGVFWLCIGRNPDLIQLQRYLWRKITGFTNHFTSLEEGNVALSKQFSERLPSLLVLDDVWEKSQIWPFMCFEDKDKGRLCITTRNGALSTSDDYHHIMKPINDVDAVSLFYSIAAWNADNNSSNLPLVSTIVKSCGGVPLAIQAVASIFYKNESALTSPFMENIMKEDSLFSVDSFGNVGVQERSIGKPDDLDVGFCLGLATSFDALGVIHPCLKECLLDLTAFPEGEWLPFSILQDIWGVGDGMQDAQIFFILSLLASRGILEWSVENLNSVDGQEAKFMNEDSCLKWKLVDSFYKLGKIIVQKELEALEFGNNSISMRAKIKNMSHKLTRESACNCFGLFEGQVNTAPLQAVSYENASLNNLQQMRCKLQLDELSIKESRHESQDDGKNTSYGLDSTDECYQTRFTLTRGGKGDHRLFIPNVTSVEYTTKLYNVPIATATTKLSVMKSGMPELSVCAEFPNLRVALLSTNEKLRHISKSALVSMANLIVLDLKQCTLLSCLPNSISVLQSLELLDLSSCSHLFTLPSSIGKLSKLRFLRLSGCISLSHLPKSLGQLSRLEVLDLSMCMRLKVLPSTLGCLSSLETLKLYGCYSLGSLPTSVETLQNLKLLELSGCSNLKYTLPCIEHMKLLLHLQRFVPLAVPVNLFKLERIEVLFLGSLKNLTYLPQIVGKLQHLHRLSLSSCRSLGSLPEDIGSLSLLHSLDLSHTAIRKLPESLGELRNLRSLCLKGCSRLLSIPSSISFLPKLEILDIAECWDVVIVPESLGNSHSLPELLELDMTGCSIKQLPYFNHGAVRKLQKLNLSGCQNLTSLPSSFGFLSAIENLILDGDKAITSLNNAGFEHLKRLSWLSLRNCTSLRSLPVSELTSLESLKLLDVSGCSGLSPFPEPILSGAREQRFTLIRWGAVWQ